METLESKVTALIAVVELTENKIGLNTLKEIQESLRWIPLQEKLPEHREIVHAKIFKHKFPLLYCYDEINEHWYTFNNEDWYMAVVIPKSWRPIL